MTESETIFNSLEEKIKKMISLYENAQEENQRLSRENIDLKEVVKLKNNEIIDLQSKCEHLKLAKLFVPNSDDVHEAKLKVNRIVREIDKCIALLNK
jgi:hypothetical protein